MHVWQHQIPALGQILDVRLQQNRLNVIVLMDTCHKEITLTVLPTWYLQMRTALVSESYILLTKYGSINLEMNLSAA